MRAAQPAAGGRNINSPRREPGEIRVHTNRSPRSGRQFDLYRPLRGLVFVTVAAPRLTPGQLLCSALRALTRDTLGY